LSDSTLINVKKTRAMAAWAERQGFSTVIHERLFDASFRRQDDEPAVALVDDPQLFGLAWPVFGVAAALSTIATDRCFGHANRLRVWAVAHLLMAAGVTLPSVWLAPVTIAIAALLVGSTFMVVTMIGMQEARARAPGNPTALLGLMTAAFATGQLAGPVVSGNRRSMSALASLL
jgi:predicted MFS family arabinose efflux permease